MWSAAILASLAFAACGATSHSQSTGTVASGTAAARIPAADSHGSEVVAEVGSDRITKAEVSHWMQALAGVTYFELSAQHTVPSGLVSDPPNYASCVSHLEAAAASAPAKATQPTSVELLTKCREIYLAMRKQAIGYLVDLQWGIDTYRDLGVTASEAELQRAFKKVKADRFSTEAQFTSYLARSRLSLADEMEEVKLNLLSAKALPKLTRRVHGVKTANQVVYAKFLDYGRAWTAKTQCKPGYVVEHCSEYRSGQDDYHGPPASVLMEQVAAIATGRCVNLAACGKS